MSERAGETTLTAIIYGASDDLIEVDGDLLAEFSAYDETEDGGSVLAFSDGTVLSVVYGAGDSGFWRINRIRTGTATYHKHEATDAGTGYSDKVTLTGDLTWCVRGKAKDYVRSRIARHLNNEAALSNPAAPTPSDQTGGAGGEGQVTILTPMGERITYERLSGGYWGAYQEGMPDRWFLSRVASRAVDALASSRATITRLEGEREREYQRWAALQLRLVHERDAARSALAASEREVARLREALRVASAWLPAIIAPADKLIIDAALASSPTERPE